MAETKRPEPTNRAKSAVSIFVRVFSLISESIVPTESMREVSVFVHLLKIFA